MASRRRKMAFVATRTGPVAGEQFSCTLTCMQCRARTPGGAAGQRCSRTVCVGLPYCWQHTRTKLNVRVGETGDAKIGKGLFAHAPANVSRHIPVFRPGQPIVTYEPAERLTKAQIDQRYDYGGFDPTAPYGFDVRSGALDAACVRSIASLVNDPKGRRPRMTSNSVFEELPQSMSRVLLRATKNIYHGEEILASYGKDYWDGFFGCPGPGRGRRRRGRQCLSTRTTRRVPIAPVPHPRDMQEYSENPWRT